MAARVRMAAVRAVRRALSHTLTSRIQCGHILAAFIVNRGRYTITRVEVQFSPDGASLLSHHRRRRVSSAGVLPSQLTGEGWALKAEERVPGVLTPWDAGVRVESDDVHERQLKSPYPVVRWVDR